MEWFIEYKDYFILIASLISFTTAICVSLITLIGNIYSNRQKYSNDYAHKIIDRRLDTYELIEQVLAKLNQSKSTNDHKRIFVFLEKVDEIDNLLNDIENIYKRELWISVNIHHILCRINRFLVYYKESIKKNDMRYINIYFQEFINDTRKPAITEEYIKLKNVKGAINQYEVALSLDSEYSQLINMLYHQINDDLIRMENVSQFLNGKNSKSSFIKKFF
ncbi:hypothetical protein [Veillonella sp. ICM51a]|uniref:hypothetical protein n=1 Tax=Veillonella sp. ICM51a TaxID=936591 RepID=UPI0004533AFA|nr:hypothetical protein [Veillonella sp. ICM51a]EUB24610.1 hypothetical protein HMPREF1504_1277 [Veillonella sp. ICM51a]DAP39189.1 MAG TPA: hypothetical protein [Caudoviricetes sp.]